MEPPRALRKAPFAAFQDQTRHHHLATIPDYIAALLARGASADEARRRVREVDRKLE